MRTPAVNTADGTITAASSYHKWGLAQGMRKMNTENQVWLYMYDGRMYTQTRQHVQLGPAQP